VKGKRIHAYPGPWLPAALWKEAGGKLTIYPWLRTRVGYGAVESSGRAGIGEGAGEGLGRRSSCWSAVRWWRRSDVLLVLGLAGYQCMEAARHNKVWKVQWRLACTTKQREATSKKCCRRRGTPADREARNVTKEFQSQVRDSSTNISNIQRRARGPSVMVRLDHSRCNTNRPTPRLEIASVAASQRRVECL
jgi:hypothetical protein